MAKTLECTNHFKTLIQIPRHVYMHTHIYIVAKTREFSENNVFNIVNVEQKQLKLLPHVVTLCFSCADDDDDLQTGA